MFCRRFVISIVSIITSFNLINDVMPFYVSAKDNIIIESDSRIEDENQPLLFEKKITYRQYLEKYIEGSKDEEYPVESIPISQLIRDDRNISGSVNISNTGFYCIEIGYIPTEDSSAEIEFSVEIDGEIPFDSAERLRLNKIYKNEKPIQKDKNGNELRPTQVQEEAELKTDIKDPDGLQNKPLVFFFEKGRHELQLNIQRGKIKAEYIKLHRPINYKTYEEYAASVDACVSIDDTPRSLIRIEGENAKYKSDPTLYPTYDNSSADISPSDPWHTIYNTIGKGNFKKSGQMLTWKLSVPNDGWYKIGIKARQEEMRGLFSNRRIYIDGEVPCEDMSEVRFYYSTDFELTEVKTSDNKELYIYLTAGETHTLTLEVVPGAIGEYIQELEDIVNELNKEYRSIVMITSPSPDKYTDYYVHEKVPGLIDDFDRIAKELRKIQSDIESLSGQHGSEASAFENMAVILEKCVSSPIKIPDYLSQIKNCISSISSWMRNYREQPLEIDYIELASKNSEFSDIDVGFLERISYGFKKFLASFKSNESELCSVDNSSDINNSDPIEVWVLLGREQTQAVRELTESEFVQEYGKAVSIKLVSGGIVEAALADEGPDAALFLSGEVPVNLGSRGLLADLSELSGFDEMTVDYTNNAFEPYTYNNKIYAVPLNRSWAMMFYRKDILSDIGIQSPPETWQELIDMLPAMQRNYMSAGLVLPEVQVNSIKSTNQISPATETGHTFAALMLQNGMNYYNDSKTKTNFDTEQAAEAFEMWTSFYTKYNLAQQYDPFSEFRTGNYPIVIADYTFCNQLSTAAPEINGLWDFTAIPGTLREDGSISHAVNSSGSGAVVFKDDDKEKLKDTWEYIKWFCSSDIQTKYAQQTENLMGQLGRYAPANLNTLKQMPWSSKELESLESSMAEIQEIPILPSSYAVTRNIMNAFRETVNNKENLRNTLRWYNRDINNEIKRKNESLN